MEGRVAVPYVIFTEANIAKVKRYSAGGRQQVGGNVSAGSAAYTRLFADAANRLYATYVDAANGNRLAVKTYNSSAVAWEPVPVPNPVSGGSVTTGATNAVRHTGISFNSARNPVVTYFNTGNSNRATIIQYNKATASWVYGGAVSTRDAPNNNLYRDKSGSLYNSFTDAIANGIGHGDALHMTDLDPDRPGQEVWQNHEDPSAYGNYRLEFRDAKTGRPLYGQQVGDNDDVGRSMAADIDPTYKGYEYGVHPEICIPAKVCRSAPPNPPSTLASGGMATCCVSCSTEQNSINGTMLPKLLTACFPFTITTVQLTTTAPKLFRVLRQTCLATGAKK